MEGAKDIGGISLTFAVGVAAGMFIINNLHHLHICYAAGEISLLS